MALPKTTHRYGFEFLAPDEPIEITVKFGQRIVLKVVDVDPASLTSADLYEARLIVTGRQLLALEGVALATGSVERSSF